jgi:hypothetical protein
VYGEVNQDLGNKDLFANSSSRIVLLDREREKIQRALTRFTDDWGDFGVSIVSDGWTNVGNQHLINLLGVSCST